MFPMNDGQTEFLLAIIIISSSSNSNCSYSCSIISSSTSNSSSIGDGGGGACGITCSLKTQSFSVVHCSARDLKITSSILGHGNFLVRVIALSHWPWQNSIVYDYLVRGII